MTPFVTMGTFSIAVGSLLLVSPLGHVSGCQTDRDATAAPAARPGAQ